jgi:AcrR family transcriptional regulator
MTSMLKRPAAAPSESRAAINDAAVRLFGQQSYTATTMRDIARAVGILPGSLYAHISSKEELLFDVVDAGIVGFLDAVRPFLERSGTPEERMRGAIKAHVNEAAAHPERSLVVFHQWRFLGDKARQDAIEKRREYERVFLSILEDGIGDGSFARPKSNRLAIFAMLGALNWIPEWYSPSGRSTPDQLGDAMADTLLHGLLTEG